MRAFAALTMKGRTQAIVGAAVFGLLYMLAIVLVPLVYVGAAVVALAVLKQGPREGVLVMLGATGLLAAFSMLVAGSPMLALLAVLPAWAPVWLGAVLLRALRDQGAALLYAAGVGALVVLLIHVSEPEPSAFWREAFMNMARQMKNVMSVDETQFAQVIEQAAPFMTRVLSGFYTLAVMLTLMLARWWQAALDNPGGFGSEFRALRLPRAVVTVALLIVVLGFTSAQGDSLLRDLSASALVLLTIQGFAVLHAAVQNRRNLLGVLVAAYVLLVLAPQLVVPAMSVLAATDGWIDLRGGGGTAAS